jgi:hypothetical protein
LLHVGDPAAIIAYQQNPVGPRPARLTLHTWSDELPDRMSAFLALLKKRGQVYTYAEALARFGID